MADSLSTQVQAGRTQTPGRMTGWLTAGESPDTTVVFRESSASLPDGNGAVGICATSDRCIRLRNARQDSGRARADSTFHGAVRILSELLSALPIPSGKTIPDISLGRSVVARDAAFFVCKGPRRQDRKQSAENFFPGCDLHHHRNLFSVCLHGSCVSVATHRYVRTSVSTYKVDTVIAQMKCGGFGRQLRQTAQGNSRRNQADRHANAEEPAICCGMKAAHALGPLSLRRRAFWLLLRSLPGSA